MTTETKEELGVRQVVVLLSQDFRSTCMGYDPTVRYANVLEFEVDGLTSQTDMDVCEVAFAVCNSYPGELRCAHQYVPAVDKYPAEGNRSLSVGDAVEVDGVRYSCDSLGFHAPVSQ